MGDSVLDNCEGARLFPRGHRLGIQFSIGRAENRVSVRMSRFPKSEAVLKTDTWRRSGNREERTENRDQGTEKREQGTGIRDQGTGGLGYATEWLRVGVPPISGCKYLDLKASGAGYRCRYLLSLNLR